MEIRDPSWRYGTLELGQRLTCPSTMYVSGNTELQFEHGSHMLSPGEERSLSFHLQEQNSGTEGNLNTLYEWINNGRLPDPVNISVRYRSATTKEYTSTFSFTPRGGRLKVDFEGMDSRSPA